MLVRLGVIADVDLQAALFRAQSARAKLGKQLVNESLVDKRVLLRALREQILLRMRSLAALPPETTYEFHSNTDLLEDGAPRALFSGGSLMVGAVGRTDLLGDEHRDHLARALFRALRTQVLTLPDDLAVYPTHGAGSFCSAPSGSARTTTIGTERATNPLLSIDDEDRFVATLLDGLGSFPTYFRQLPEINRRGPRLYRGIPELPRLDLDSVRERLDSGAVLVDCRPIDEYALAHPHGAISIAHRPVFAS
jgi:hypothetical protein